MKFKVINGEPLQFHNTSGDLTGTIIMSSSGDMIIRPESGSNKDVIIGDLTSTGTVSIGTIAAPSILNFAGGGTVTSNGYTLYIGDTSDTVIIRNAQLNAASFTSSLIVTGSITSHQGVFFGNGSGLTNIVPNFTGSGITSGSFQVIGPTTLQNTTINGTSNLNGNVSVTGSFTVSGSYQTTGTNRIPANLLVQSTLLYLSNNF
jgi:hypothetical protein